MPLLTLDPTQESSLSAPTDQQAALAQNIQQNNLNPVPQGPSPPVETADTKPAIPPGTPPGAPPRTMGTAQVFTPFRAKDPNNPDDVNLLAKVNDFVAGGGKVSDLDADVLQGIEEAATGKAADLQDRDVLNDPDAFYRLKFQTGKYERPMLDDIGNPSTYMQHAWDAMVDLVGTVKNTVVGAYETVTRPQEIPAQLAEGLQATYNFYKSLGLTPDNPLAALGGISPALQIATGAGAQSIANDWATRWAKMFAGPQGSDQWNQIDREQSEIVRNRMLLDQNNSDSVLSAKYKAADGLADIGFGQLANITQKASITPEQLSIGQMATDPLSYLEFGTGKILGALGESTLVGTRFGRLEAATRALEDTGATADNLAAQRVAFKGIIRAPGATDAEKISAQRALGAMTPADRDAQAAYQGAVQEHQGALAAANQDMTDAAKPSLGRQAVAQLAQGTGTAMETAGKALDWWRELPTTLLDKTAPNLPSAIRDPIAGTVQDIWERGPGAIGGGITGAVLGGPIGAVIGGGAGGYIGGLITKAIGKISPALAESVGHNLAMIGEQFGLGQETLPFWRGISENTTGLTSWMASKLDNQLVYAIPNTARAAATNALIGGGLGYLQSGGMTRPTLAGAVQGAALGAVGGGLGQLKTFNSPGELHAAAIGDRARFLRSLSPQNAQLFQALDPGSQLGIGVYARAHPDLDVGFVHDPSPNALNGNHQVIDGRGLATINVAGDNPFETVLAHEIGHHIASHGLGGEVFAQMVGNPGTGTPGIFAKLDDTGKPLVQVNPDGTQSYVPNDEFEGYKANYNARLPTDHPKAGNYEIAQEMFADLHAKQFSDPAQVQKQIRGFIPSAEVGDNVIRNWLTRVGVGADTRTGESNITDAVSKTKGLSDILSNFYRQRSYRANPPSDDTGMVKVPVNGTRRGTDEFNRMAQSLDSTNDIRRNSDGSIWTGTDGRPQVVKPQVADAQHALMTDDVIKTIKANPQYQLSGGDWLKEVTDRRNRTYYRGQQVQPEVLDALAASNQHNPVQVLNWRKLNGIMSRNDGTAITTVYNTAGRQGRYATVPARERALVPLYNEISPDSRQINILSYDPEQMSVNITKTMRGNAAKAAWDGNIQAAHDDIKTYLDNLANGRPGEAELGLSKKALINNLFGLKADANPLIEDVTRKSPSVFKTFRLDRMNRVNELATSMPAQRQTYEQVLGYAQPRRGTVGEPVTQVPVQTQPQPQKVSDILASHPVLDKYPWAKDLPVTIHPDMEPMGRFIEGDTPQTSEIQLKDPSYTGTLGHELVHLQQAVEDKPRGGSSLTMWTGNRRAATLALAQKLFEDLKTPRSLADYAQAAGFDSIKDARKSYNTEYLPGFQGKANLERLWRLAQEGAGEQAYQALPGEQEARKELPQIASVDEAHRLPAGTHFLDPNGVRRRVPLDHELPTPQTPQEAKKLPSGSHFLDPKGNRRRVP